MFKNKTGHFSCSALFISFSFEHFFRSINPNTTIGFLCLFLTRTFYYKLA